MGAGCGVLTTLPAIFNARSLFAAGIKADG
jgi:hypothetical protein